MHRKVLLVDDSEADRVVLKQHLNGDPVCSYSFLEAATSADALRQLAGDSIDCVFLDSALPGGEALGILTALQGSGKPLPVVLVATVEEKDSVVELMRAGAHDFLVKPHSVAELLRMAVHNAMSRATAQAELAEQRSQLQHRNEELLAAKNAAERANAFKDDFLAMISHELRTPLTPVLSIVSATLESPELTPDLRETFSLIRRNIELEARLIDDLLDLTRTMEGKLEIQRHPVDLNACARAASDLLKAEIGEKQIVAEFKWEAGPAMVVGDFARLQQLCGTLLKNAAEMTPPGGRIEMRSRTEEGNVIVEVQDWSGEARQHEERPFQWAVGASRPGSLALGFAIANAIAEAHGGRLLAKRNPNGSVFSLCLPVQGPVKNDEKDALPGRFRGKTILVVEDHEDTRRVLSRALRRKGFGVTFASTVEGAYEKYSLSPTDLVICDIGLPDGTGWDVMRRLKKVGPVKAVAVSGYGMEQDRQRSREAGFSAHITKPVDFPRLESLIANLLERK